MWPTILERLDGNAFKALFYMLTFEEGDNNGDIYMGARSLGDGIGVDKKTALRCLQHLDRQGFIRPEQLGYFRQKGGPATRWRFTFMSAGGKPPTNEWRQPPSEQKSWVEKLPSAGGKTPPSNSVCRTAGGKVGTVSGLSDQSPGGISRTHTVAIGEGRSGTDPKVNLPSDLRTGPFAAGEAA